MNKNQRDDEEERSEDAPLVAEPQSFGTWLRRQREVREIDLREIADSTKVSMSYLQAFEEDRFGVLPSPVFAKGFLRQYARYVGLDPEEVVNFYLAARDPEGEAEPSLESRTVSEQPSRKVLYFALAVIALLVLVVWLLSTYGKTLGLGKRSEANRSRVLVSSQEPEAESLSLPAVGVAVPSPATSTALPIAEPLVEKESDSHAEPEEPGSADTGQSPVWVTLDFMSDCWVEASVDGVKELSELRVQGESLLLRAEEIVEFKIGDVGAVQVEVNGMPFEIENRTGTSVRSVRIDLETVAAIVAHEGP